MNMWTLPLLLVAMTALSRAAVLPDAETGKETEAEDIPVLLVAEAGEQAETEGDVDLLKRTSSCPWGWRKYGQRCFRFVPRLMTWSDAERNCWSMGAILASVHDAGEYHWIQKLIADQAHSHPLAWLGGTDLAKEGRWQWIDGSHFVFPYWCRGEPNNRFGQDCLQMNYSGKKCWDDTWCHYYKASVCAKKIW